MARGGLPDAGEDVWSPDCGRPAAVALGVPLSPLSDLQT